MRQIYSYAKIVLYYGLDRNLYWGEEKQMNIDDSMIKSYLADEDHYVSHWLFNSILDNGEYTFYKPNKEDKEKVKEIYEKTYSSLSNFTPYNVSIFSKLFPNWTELIEDINIILAVGCPSPYDAMVREYDGVEYVIFDLIRFMSYEKNSDDIVALIRGMITHEFTHICIHNIYPFVESEYINKLKYITFDEGFAHLLAFNDNITSYDFSKIINLYYENAFSTLQIALSETDALKQNDYLEKSNSGAYWSKFAAISGKLYLALNIDYLYDIYNLGPAVMITKMGL